MFEAVLADPCDIALMVQDYPLEGLDESKDSYLSDARSFIAASRAAGVRAAVCSTLPENLDRTTREMLVAAGVAPMQGLREALDAIAGAVWHGRRRQRMREEARADGVGTGAAPPIGAGCAFGTEVEAGDRVEAEAGAGAEAETGVEAAARPAGTGPVVTSVDEHRARRWLHGVGIPIPAGCVTGAREAACVAARGASSRASNPPSSSRQSSPISPRARPAASIPPRTAAPSPASPTSGLPISGPVLTATAGARQPGCASPPVPFGLRRLPDMGSCLPARNRVTSTAIRLIYRRWPHRPAGRDLIDGHQSRPRNRDADAARERSCRRSLRGSADRSGRAPGAGAPRRRVRSQSDQDEAGRMSNHPPVNSIILLASKLGPSTPSCP